MVYYVFMFHNLYYAIIKSQIKSIYCNKLFHNTEKVIEIHLFV
jgi:hypothetical protein